MAELSGKRIIVTGAGSGIGRASAERAAALGASVLAVDLSDRVEDTAASITASGGVAIATKADAGAEEAVQSYVAQCIDAFGGIDGVYANAGVSGGGKTLFELTVEDWQNVLRVNLVGPFLAIKHAAPHMIEAGSGSIVCTASVAGLRANAGGVDYSASKAGVVSLAQTSANALYGTGVRINAICPGLIETGMTAPLFERARARGTDDRIGQLNPTRRNGEPREIAALACFLLSDAASYINGQAIAADGGLSSTHPFVFAGR